MALLPALMLEIERKEGRVNINYRFPGVYIESNLATVRNTPVIDMPQVRCLLNG